MLGYTGTLDYSVASGGRPPQTPRLREAVFARGMPPQTPPVTGGSPPCPLGRGFAPPEVRSGKAGPSGEARPRGHRIPWGGAPYSLGPGWGCAKVGGAPRTAVSSPLPAAASAGAEPPRRRPFYRVAKILEIGEGTSEVQRMLFAREVGLGGVVLPGEENARAGNPNELTITGN
jgi:hypothetical protein